MLYRNLGDENGDRLLFHDGWTIHRRSLRCGRPLGHETHDAAIEDAEARHLPKSCRYFGTTSSAPHSSPDKSLSYSKL
jgi:hypothetical protein